MSEAEEKFEQKLRGLTLISGTSKGTIDHPNFDKIFKVCKEYAQVVSTANEKEAGFQKIVVKKKEKHELELAQKIKNLEEEIKFLKGRPHSFPLYDKLEAAQSNLKNIQQASINLITHIDKHVPLSNMRSKGREIKLFMADLKKAITIKTL